MVSEGGSLGVSLGLLLMTPPFVDADQCQSLLELVRDLDASKFDALFFVDHMFLEGDRYLAFERDVDRPYQLECYSILAACAAVTSRIRLGTLVTPLPLRHPAFVAKMAATIDVLSRGRLVLGVGTGWPAREYEAYGLPFETSHRRRTEMVVEAMEMMRSLFGSPDPVDYAGEHYHLQRAPFFPKPVQGARLPMWVGGSGTTSRDLVAKLGDGWTPAAPHYNAVSPDVYRQGWADIRERATAYGRNPEEITPAVLINTTISRTRGAAWGAASAQQLRVDWKDISLESMQESGVLAVGTAEDCLRQIERYAAAGARYVTVCPVPMTMDNARRTVEHYAEGVLPRLGDVAVRN